MEKRPVIFDLDGTLLNTLEDLKDALNHALQAHSFPPRTLAQTRRFVGNGNWKLILRGVPQGTDEAAARAVFATFMDYYQAHSMDKTRPYDGVGELLDTLREKGHPMAIVTNKVHTAALPLCAKFFPQVDVVVGAREGVQSKPAPDMVRLALDTLGGGEGAVYVGDSEVDLATARNAGLACVCVTWGFRDKEELAAQGGKIFAATPQELLQILTR